MAKQNIISSNWYSFNKLLVTEISGNITLDDVVRWEQSFQKALDKIPANSRFRVMINLHGFNPVITDVHNKVRDLVPMILSNYGWKVGYLDLFEEAAILQVSNTRGIECMAAAHVHHDPEQISLQQARFGKVNEQFFTDPERALCWLRNTTTKNVYELKQQLLKEYA